MKPLPFQRLIDYISQKRGRFITQKVRPEVMLSASFPVPSDAWRHRCTQGGRGGRGEGASHVPPQKTLKNYNLEMLSNTKVEDPGPSQIFSQPHVPLQKNLKMTVHLCLTKRCCQKEVAPEPDCGRMFLSGKVSASFENDFKYLLQIFVSYMICALGLNR